MFDTAINLNPIPTFDKTLKNKRYARINEWNNPNYE